MRFIVLNEMKEFLYKNTKVFLLSVLALAFSCVAINITLTYYLDAVELQNEMEESYGNRNFYKIMVNGDDEALADFFSADNVEKIKLFFDEMNNASDFEYRYVVENSIEFFDENNPDYGQKNFPAHKDTCLYGYETGDASYGDDYICLKGIFADHLFGTEPTLSLAKGNWFTSEEFYIDSQDNIEIPVILGNEYAEYNRLGDRIKNAHIGTVDNITLIVKGFLEENSYFYDNNNDKVLLNRYMVVPAVEVSAAFPYQNQDGSYNDFFLNLYDSLKIMNARVICESKFAKKVKKEVNQICKKAELYEIRINDETAGAAKELDDTKEITNACLMISIIVIVLSTIVYGIQLNYKLVKDRKKYSIFILNGITRRQLFSITIADSLLVFVAADIVFIVFWLFNFSRGNSGLGLSGYTFILIPMIELIILIIMGLYGTMQTMKINMSTILRENE